MSVPLRGTRLSRRTVLGAALGGVGGIVLAACGGGVPTSTVQPPPRASSPSPAAPTAAPKTDPAKVAEQAKPTQGAGALTGSAPASGVGTPNANSLTPATGGAAVGSASPVATAPPSAAQAGASTAAAGIAPSAAGTAGPGATVAAKPAASPVALPKPGTMPAGSYMKQVLDRGKLIAGVKTDVLLFGYLNPRSNKIEGFDVDICKEIARAIFGDPEKVEFKEVTSASRIPSLNQGIVDVAAATMTITKTRLNEIDMSDVYYEAGQRLLVPKNSPIKSIQDAGGKRLCAAKGSTSEVNITKFQPQAQVVQADKYTDCLLALQQGRADGVSTDDAILAGLAEQDPNTQVVGDRFTQEPYGIGLAKGKEGMLPFVNAVLVDIKRSGRWTELYKQWLGKYLPLVEPPTRSAQEAAV